MDLRHVRDNLGHKSISTTSSYLQAPDEQRHRDTEENTGSIGSRAPLLCFWFMR
ncbi:MAG: integrase [Burkholderia sp.]|nr:integrase [Burkholderia sp.]